MLPSTRRPLCRQQAAAACPHPPPPLTEKKPRTSGLRRDISSMSLRTSSRSKTGKAGEGQAAATGPQLAWASPLAAAGGSGQRSGCHRDPQVVPGLASAGSLGAM